MHNYEVKQYAKRKSVFHYEIAKELNLSEPVFSKLFRDEMCESTRQSILDAVDHIYQKKNSMGAVKSIGGICDEQSPNQSHDGER